MAWGWACRSRAPSSTRMGERFGWTPIRPVAPSFASRCARSARRNSAMPSDVVVHVIDDDDAVRESLEFLLRTARLEVRTYESAAAFLRILPGVEVGCIITDVRMPELSGIDLL